MDNTNFNYVAGEEGIKSGAKLFQDRAGEIDILNIKYLYGDYKVYEDTIYNSCKLFSEAPVLGNSYIFGSKKSLNGFIDPESLNSDLGDNQIKSSTIGLETLQKVVENGAGWLDLQDIDFNYRASLYDFIIDKYFFYITNVTASIGGKIKDEINGYCEIVDFKNQKDALLWSLERIKEADKFENEELMSQSELNVGIADYITEESFRAVLQKVLSMTEYRETMLSVIDKFVWQNYPQSTNINNKELRTIKMQTLYINTLIKEIGLDKDEVKEIWSKPDNYVVYQLLVQNKQKIYNNQNVGSKAFRDNNAYLLKLLNDKL